MGRFLTSIIFELFVIVGFLYGLYWLNRKPRNTEADERDVDYKRRNKPILIVISVMCILFALGSAYMKHDKFEAAKKAEQEEPFKYLDF